MGFSGGRRERKRILSDPVPGAVFAQHVGYSDSRWIFRIKKWAGTYLLGEKRRNQVCLSVSVCVCVCVS